MKGELTKQQALFDRERGQAMHDRESTFREWEEMKRLNDQLLAQIVTLQNTWAPLHRQIGPLLRRLQVTSGLKVGGVAEWPPSLHQSNPMMGGVRLIPARRFDLVILGGRLKSSSVSKISTSSYESELKKRVCHIMGYSGRSPLMHPILFSPRTCWNMNFPRSS